MRAAARSKTVDAEQDELRGVRARAGARVVRSSQEAPGRAGADDDASDARSSRLRERLTAEELQEPSTATKLSGTCATKQQASLRCHPKHARGIDMALEDIPMERQRTGGRRSTCRLGSC